MILVVLLACGTSSKEPSAEESVRLEAFEATDSRSIDGNDTLAEGLAAVSGAERDWTLVVDTSEEEDASIGIHSPGGSDLAILDGHTLAVTVGGAWSDATVNVGIDDEEGPVYLFQTSGSGPATDLFGEGFIDYGEELGVGELEDEFGTYSVSYRRVDVQSDDGVVEVLAGEPVEVKLGGGNWRLVVHAAFEVTEYPDTMPGCGGGIGTTLDYELLRVSTAPDLEKRAAEAGKRLAGVSSCG